MSNEKLSTECLQNFYKHLVREEKSKITIEKYMRDVKDFFIFVKDGALTKEAVIEYKKHLTESYAVRSVNSKLASINSFLSFLHREDCRVKNLRLQRETYLPEEKELSKEEYLRLLQAASNNPRLRLIIETICGTGIRVSELRYFTVEGVKSGKAESKSNSQSKTESAAKTATEKPAQKLTQKPEEKQTQPPTQKPTQKPTQPPAKAKTVDVQSAVSACIEYGKQLGMNYDSSLNTSNASWFSPTNASYYDSTSELTSDLKSDVEYVAFYYQSGGIVPSDLSFNIVLENNKIYVVYC